MMGLIAWYPLNGDLKDYSGNENHGTAVGNPIETSGKIGKTYSFDSDSQYISIPHNDMVSSKVFGESRVFSLCSWVYATQLQNWACIINKTAGDGTWSSATTGLWISTQGITFIIGSNVNGNPEGSRSAIDYAGVELNKWYHVAGVSDGIKMKLYINGELVNNLLIDIAHKRSENTAPIIIGRRSATINPTLKGKINDIRIYDHALSEKEVKEISKAKILHYTFDKFVEPTENLFHSLNLSLIIYNNFKVPATLVATGGRHMGQPIYRLGMTVDDASASHLNNFRTALGGHGVHATPSMPFKASTKYAASIYWKAVNKQDTRFGGTASNILGWTALPNESFGEWNRYTAIRDGSVIENKSDSVFFSFYCPSLELNETIFIDVCCVQIEELKDYSTEYTSSIRKDNIIRDNSGFGNDGIIEIETSPQWIRDGGKVGKGYYKFSNDIIRTKQLFFDNINQSWTVCGWVYINDFSKPDQIFNNFNIGNELMHGRGKALLYINDTINDSYVYSRDLVPGGEWFHISYVLDTLTLRCQIYINGTLDASSTNYSITDIPRGFVSSTLFGQNLNGMMDDIRVYATDLSSEDILEVYMNRVSIDDVGNLYPQSLNERHNLAWLVDKTMNEKKFENGVTWYRQSNLQVTLTDDGYRIYSPPNLIHSEVGNTVWGGLRLNLFAVDTDIIKKGHKYKISFTVTGQSSRYSSYIYFSNNMGHGGEIYGLGTDAAIESTRLLGGFKGIIEMYAIFHITEDVWKTCTESYTVFTKGEKYNCYKDLCFNFSYDNTGPLGTDIYITDFRVEDITDGEGVRITNNGILESSKISETSITEGLVAWWKLDGDIKDYSINGNHGTIVRPINLFDYNKWSKNGVIPVVGGSINNWDSNSFTMTNITDDCYTGAYGKADYMLSVKPNTIYTLIYYKGSTVQDHTYIFHWNSTDYYTAYTEIKSVTSGKQVITFTTPSYCTLITVRFGIRGSIGQILTFSDMQLVEGVPSNGPTISNGLGQLCYDFKYDTLDRITIGNLSNVIVPDTYNFSISVWACSNDIAKDQNIISKNSPFFIRIVGSCARYCLSTSIGTWVFVPGKIKLESSKWYNIVMTYDGINLKGYVNGVLDVTATKTGSVAIGGSLAYIGYIPHAGEQAPFSGKIQDIRIYNRTLAPEEVSILHDMQYSNTKIADDGTLYIKGKFKEVIV